MDSKFSTTDPRRCLLQSWWGLQPFRPTRPNPRVQDPRTRRPTGFLYARRNFEVRKRHKGSNFKVLVQKFLIKFLPRPVHCTPVHTTTSTTSKSTKPNFRFLCLKANSELTSTHRLSRAARRHTPTTLSSSSKRLRTNTNISYWLYLFPIKGAHVHRINIIKVEISRRTIFFSF